MLWFERPGGLAVAITGEGGGPTLPSLPLLYPRVPSCTPSSRARLRSASFHAFTVTCCYILTENVFLLPATNRIKLD